MLYNRMLKLGSNLACQLVSCSNKMCAPLFRCHQATAWRTFITLQCNQRVIQIGQGPVRLATSACSDIIRSTGSHHARMISKDVHQNTGSHVQSDEVDLHERSDEESEVKATKKLIGHSKQLDNFQTQLASNDNLHFSQKDWDKLREDSISENPALAKSWESLCMQLMFHNRQASLASSFVDYLSTKSPPLNISVLSVYIALQGKHGTEGKEDVILEAYKKVLNITELFDAVTAKYLIIGLCHTSQWQTALGILDMARLTTQVGPSYYSPIIVAAIKHQDTDLAFRLIDQLALNDFEPDATVLKEILNSCCSSGCDALLEKYLDYAKKHRWMLSKYSAENAEEYFTRSKKENWVATWTGVNTVRGFCYNCQHKLESLELSTAEFESLREGFLEKGVFGKNIYYQSNPAEVQRFQDFIQKHAPFDVVLDALNIALRNQAGPKARAMQIRVMVDYFVRKYGMKVLVLGRAHMKKWHAQDLTYVKKHAKVFFTENISADDPFCLYAALYSGKHCLYVSGDYMRQHKSKLGGDLGPIFRRWQASRQIFNFTIYQRNVTVEMPSKYDYGPVKDEHGWHIPYRNSQDSFLSGAQSVLCLRQQDNDEGEKSKSKRRTNKQTK